MNRSAFVSRLLCVLVALAPLSASAEWPDLSKPASVAAIGEKDAAVVIGVEHYIFAPAVPGAERNAADWYVYLTRSRRVPASRIHLLRGNEATLEAMEQQAHWAASVVEPGGVLWFVFVGHGAPAKDGHDGVLVGVDAQQTVASLYARSLPQSRLLAALGAGKQQRTVAILDACFSGRTADGAPLVPGVQPMIAVSQLKPAANAIVLTAAKSNQFAGELPGESRPAFSYLLLGALRGWAAGGDQTVTVSEAVTYVQESMQTIVKDRQQTPEVYGNGADFVLARNAREEGPELSDLVLEDAPTPPAKSEVAFTTKAVDVQVPKVKIEAGGGVTFAAINLEAEQRLETAMDKEDSADASAADKAKAWCALASLNTKNPYLEKAKDACRQWGEYAKKREAIDRSLSADFATLTGYVALKHKTKEQKLAVVDAFLAAYGSLDDDKRVKDAQALRATFAEDDQSSGAPTMVLHNTAEPVLERGQQLLKDAREAYKRHDIRACREALKQAQDLGWNDLDLTNALLKEQ